MIDVAFQRYLRITGDAQASATLVLAEILRGWLEADRGSVEDPHLPLAKIERPHKIPYGLKERP